eukprot:13416561-Heterocapsa_arctica.AAC.1
MVEVSLPLELGQLGKDYVRLGLNESMFQWALQVFEGCSGILALTIIFLAERLSFCTKSELESQS